MLTGIKWVIAGNNIIVVNLIIYRWLNVQMTIRCGVRQCFLYLEQNGAKYMQGQCGVLLK